jgi:hypothetical protein
LLVWLLTSSLHKLFFFLLVRLTLTLTPRVLGTLACVHCFCEYFCRMKKLSHGLKNIFSPGTSHHGSGSHSSSDGMSLDSRRFSSFMPLHHEAAPSSHHPVNVETPPIDDDDISIHSHGELERFESLGVREFAHTHVYDVSLLEHVGLDIELPTVIRSIGWRKLYDEPRSGFCVGGCLGPSHGAETSTSTEFPHWYYPLERYISYRVDQVERAVEGIVWIKSRMGEFERV